MLGVAHRCPVSTPTFIIEPFFDSLSPAKVFDLCRSFFLLALGTKLCEVLFAVSAPYRFSVRDFLYILSDYYFIINMHKLFLMQKIEKFVFYSCAPS